jgi:hypothetical protein
MVKVALTPNSWTFGAWGLQILTMTNKDGFWKEGPREDLIRTSFERREGLVKIGLREGIKFQNWQHVGWWFKNLTKNNNLNVQITISFWQWKCKNHVSFLCMTVDGNFFNEIFLNFIFQKINTSLWFSTQYLG